MESIVFQKIIPVLFCAVFVFVCVSCSTGNPEEIVPEYINDIPGEIDLNGKTYVFGMVKDYFFEGKDSVLTYIYNTQFGDLALKRLREVENKHNCTIEFKYHNRSGEAAYIDVVSSSHTNDLIQEESYWLVSYIPTGVFTDLKLLDNIDITNTEKWGNPKLLLSTMWIDAVYGVVPAQHPLRTQNSVSNIIAINEDYIKTLGVSDPRDFYENKTWDWETFTNVLYDYTFTALSGDKVYSFATDASRFARAVAFSNGDEYIKYVPEDDTFKLGLYSSTALLALNQYFDWLNGPTKDNILLEAGLDPLKDGRTVLGNVEAFEVLSNTDSIAYNLDNFGIIPYPYGPDAEPGWYQCYNESTDFTICIPVSAVDPEGTAVVMESIYEPFEGYETRESIIDYLDKNYFLDTRDSKFFVEISDYKNTYFFATMDGLFDVWNEIVVRKPSEALAKYKDIMYDKAEKNLLPRLRTSYNTFGE